MFFIMFIKFNHIQCIFELFYYLRVFIYHYMELYNYYIIFINIMNIFIFNFNLFKNIIYRIYLIYYFHIIHNLFLQTNLQLINEDL